MKAIALPRTWIVSALGVILFALLAFAVAVASGNLARSASSSLSATFGQALSQESAPASQAPAAQGTSQATSAITLITPAPLNSAPVARAVRTTTSGSSPSVSSPAAAAPTTADDELAAGRAAAANNPPLIAP